MSQTSGRRARWAPRPTDVADLDPDEVVREGGVRTYARFTAAHALRRRRTLRRLGAVGTEVHVERDVRILRHPERVQLGSRVMLKEGARLCPTNPDARITVGDWTTIGHHTFVFATTGITIGPDCLIAPFCYLIDNEHGIEPGQLIRTQPMSASPITIGAGTWLGTGVVVTKGVTIGEGAVVGARSVVTRDLPAHAIAVGSPARVIGSRAPA